MKIQLFASICAAFMLTACQPAASKTNLPTSEEETKTSSLDQTILAWAEENKFNGVIAVGQDSETLALLSTGIADHQSGRVLTNDSVFQTGSIDKFFASILVFTLAEMGDLDLDAPISNYLSEGYVTGGDQITLAHLMSNRSGLPASFRSVFAQMMNGLKSNPGANLTDLGLDMSLAESVAKYSQGDLTAKPGTRFDYVYANWVVVHHILEAVTGQSYGALLQRHIFEPVGANRSGVFDMTLDPDEVGDTDIAVGFDADDGFHTGDFPVPSMLGGGSYTTGTDMIRILDGLYGGKIISEPSLNRFSTFTTLDENYAYGGRVMTYKTRPAQLYSWQSGSNGATNMVAVRAIDDGYSFVAMSNTSHSQDDMFKLSGKVEEKFRSGG